ncbi:hypothetical protein [Agaribacter flavus]|uniref:Restriction endonuclease n=1 Tax=Agaribacter flavus TaxID=1902781 RepID=A0ABV7FRJ3_9ALTE
MKILNMEVVAEPTSPYDTEESENTRSIYNHFLLPLQQLLVSHIDPKTETYSHIDFDTIKTGIEGIIDRVPEGTIARIKTIGIDGKSISSPQWKSAKAHRGLMFFLQYFPEFSNLIANVNLLASIAIKSAEVHLKEKISAENFVQAKAFYDQINRQRWTRPLTPSEQQSGVSNLGSFSEALIQKALEGFIDGKNFFKTNNPKVQSYGDFVLMCLPNNLWLSVKSNFARERLLASGYTTDIIGVGFFTDSNEFTSSAKIRNFQRVGFLAMYLPDIPISENQINDQSNTYSEVVRFYNGIDNLPVNINGTKFIRPLSSLSSDLGQLLKEPNLANRIASDF